MNEREAFSPLQHEAAVALLLLLLLLFVCSFVAAAPRRSRRCCVAVALQCPVPARSLLARSLLCVW